MGRGGSVRAGRVVVVGDRWALQVTQQAVSAWYRGWLVGGREALTSPGTPGAQCRLDRDQRDRLRELLLDGARTHGFATDSWTLARVRRVIAEQFGVEHATLNGVSELLHRMGWSPQKPSRHAVERDEDTIPSGSRTPGRSCKKGGRDAGPGCAAKTKPAPG